MDFLRSRAAAALAAAIALPSAYAADCTALNGTYAAESVEKADGAPRGLESFVPDRARSQLFRREQAPEAAKPQGLGGAQPRARPARAVRLASSVRVTYAAGAARLRFLDAEGKVLIDTSMVNQPAAWKCAGERLERSFETMGGLGNAVRTERTVQALSRTAEGDLVLAETTTVVKPAPGAPRTSEFRFKRLAAAAPAGK